MMFAVQCRGEAFAIIGMHAFIPKLANASPLLFQRTKLSPKKELKFLNIELGLRQLNIPLL